VERGILFVDDEERILSALARELRPWFSSRNLTFWPARSGEAALEFLHAHHRRVLAVVADMKMPGIAGEALLEQIGTSWPEIHTMVLSGHAELAGLSRAVGAGIRSFLTKPWEPEALTGALDRAIRLREQARLSELERAHVTHQLTRTRDIQTTLFRRDPIDPTHFGIELTYRPLTEQICGGDFYEVIQSGPGGCTVVIGDVAGHGAEAAFITGILHTLTLQPETLRFLVDEPDPGRFLQTLNRLVFAELSTDQARNVALSVLVFHRGSSTVSYASAGGLPLLRLRDGEGSAFHLQGLPLGFTPEVDYPSRSIRTLPGDRWLVMTDGLLDRGKDGLLPGPDLVRIAAEAYRSGRGHQGILEDCLGLFPWGSFLDDLTLVTVDVR